MQIWAIADLHLCFGTPDKSMEVFGSNWEKYCEKIEMNWQKNIAKEDLVLIAGDISWAMSLEKALIDLKWIDSQPGTKVMIKGNHDYWWSSLSKVSSSLPPSIHLIQNTAFNYRGISIGGARLWDTDEYSFNILDIDHERNREVKSETQEEMRAREKIFQRELSRLELSLNQVDQKADLRIAMTHYPPIGIELRPSKASRLLEKYNIDVCVFGHLHNIKKDLKIFGISQGIDYFLTSSDYLNFNPLKIASF